MITYRSNLRRRAMAACALRLLLSCLAAPVWGVDIDPVLVGSCPGLAGGGEAAVAVSGNYSYVVGSHTDGTNWTANLDVIDVGNPASPKRVGGVLTSRDVSSFAPGSVAVSGNYAYLAAGWSEGLEESRGGLEVIDISNPSNPRRVGEYETGGFVRAVAVSGNHAFVVGEGRWQGTNWNAALCVINVSDPANPTQVGTVTNLVGSDVAVSGHHAYVAGARYDGSDWLGCLQVIDISNPADPQLVGTAGGDFGGTRGAFGSTGVAVSGHHAFVTYGGDKLHGGGMAIIDISEPSAPTTIAWHQVGSSYDVAVSGSVALVVHASVLELVDISNPASPHRVGGYDNFTNTVDGWPMGVAVSGSFAYVADRDSGLQVLEMRPFFRSISEEGQHLTLSWEGFGSARLQRATRVTNPDWQELVGSENTNTVTLPIWGGSEFFRLVASATGDQPSNGDQLSSQIAIERQIRLGSVGGPTASAPEKGHGEGGSTGASQGSARISESLLVATSGRQSPQLSRMSRWPGRYGANPLGRQILDLGALSRQGSPDLEFVPTPQAVVDKMIEMAGLKPGDVVYDLGCGDGRIVVAAAKQYGGKAVGVDIDPEMVRIARENAEANGVGHLVRIDEGDLFKVDLSAATVVMLYLLPELNDRLKPRLERLMPGARVVSHDFGLSRVKPAKVHVMMARDDRGRTARHTIYQWTMPWDENFLGGSGLRGGRYQSAWGNPWSHRPAP